MLLNATGSKPPLITSCALLFLTDLHIHTGPEGLVYTNKQVNLDKGGPRCSWVGGKEESQVTQR